MYWKEAWLERVGSTRAPESQRLGPEEDAFVEGTLLEATKGDASGTGKPASRCQATQVREASTQLRGWHFNQYRRDARNWGASEGPPASCSSKRSTGPSN
jgi:hypothetical protein